MADSSMNLLKLVPEFRRVCNEKVENNFANKSNVINFNCRKRQVSWIVNLNGENMLEVKYFRYLGADMAGNRTMEVEVSHRKGQGAKVIGA